MYVYYCYARIRLSIFYLFRDWDVLMISKSWNSCRDQFSVLGLVQSSYFALPPKIGMHYKYLYMFICNYVAEIVYKLILQTQAFSRYGTLSEFFSFSNFFYTFVQAYGIGALCYGNWSCWIADQGVLCGEPITMWDQAQRCPSQWMRDLLGKVRVALLRIR